jgi:hypothetical protein
MPAIRRGRSGAYVLSAVRQNAFVPLLYRAFDFSKFTEEQQSAIRQFQIAAVNNLNPVAYFGSHNFDCNFIIDGGSQKKIQCRTNLASAWS